MAGVLLSKINTANGYSLAIAVLASAITFRAGSSFIKAHDASNAEKNFLALACGVLTTSVGIIGFHEPIRVVASIIAAFLVAANAGILPRIGWPTSTRGSSAATSA